jgi:hypothetical protein
VREGRKWGWRRRGVWIEEEVEEVKMSRGGGGGGGRVVE